MKPIDVMKRNQKKNWREKLIDIRNRKVSTFKHVLPLFGFVQFLIQFLRHDRQINKK